MSIWVTRPDINDMQHIHLNTAVDRLGIEFVDVGDDWISARMPVDARTVRANRHLARRRIGRPGRNPRQLRGQLLRRHEQKLLRGAGH